MKRTDLPPLLQRMVARTPYATIATVCPDGQPWNSPVRACLDEDLQLYWVSARSSIHSQNLEHESRIFVVIYDSHLQPRARRRGLYMQMRGAALTDLQEVWLVRKKFGHIFGEQEDKLAFTGDNPRRIYKAIPTQLWVNDVVRTAGYPIDIRHKLA